GRLVPSSVALRLAVCAPAPVTHFPGPAPGACFAGSHSLRPPHLAPPTPQPVARLCSSASQLLLRSLTSHVRSSSATAPRLPDAGQSGAPLIRPRVQHARGRQEPVNELSHPFPRQPVPLTASSQTLEPFHADVIAECREQVSVRRYREVGEVAFDHGCEPPPLFVDRLMPVLSQRFLDLPKLGLHPLSLCLAPELEVGAVLLGAAVVCEPQEIERFR